MKKFMRSEFEIFDELIHNDFIIKNTAGKIVFKESEDVPCRKITFETSKKVFAFAPDNNKSKPIRIFKNTVPNMLKLNDGVIIFKKNDELCILLIEMKSNNTGKAIAQIKSGRNLVEYIISQINLFFPIKIEKYEYRAVIFKTGMISPQKATSRKQKIKWQESNGDYYTEMPCNNTYKIQQFRESIMTDSSACALHADR